MNLVSLCEHCLILPCELLVSPCKDQIVYINTPLHNHHSRWAKIKAKTTKIWLYIYREREAHTRIFGTLFQYLVFLNFNLHNTPFFSQTYIPFRITWLSLHFDHYPFDYCFSIEPLTFNYYELYYVLEQSKLMISRHSSTELGTQLFYIWILILRLFR